MAYTPNQICTSIAQKLGRELDEPFKRMLMLDVDTWYSTLLSRSLEKNPSQRGNFRLALYLNMEDYNIAQDCSPAIPLCKIRRTIAEVPIVMRLDGVKFDFVGSIDGQTPFREATPGTLYFLNSGRYSKNTLHYELKSSHIEILDQDKIPMIRVDAVWDRPFDAMQLNCLQSGDCDIWNKVYPATNDIIQMIIQYVLQITYNQKVQEDKTEIPVTNEKNP